MMDTSEYNEIDKYYILNGHLKLCTYVRAVPIDEKNPTNYYGFLTKIEIENNLYSKTSLTIKYNQNGQVKFKRIFPIKYNMYYKNVCDNKRKLFINLLEKLNNQ